MWAQIINVILGIWLMVAPSVLYYNQVGANNGHIIGPLVITFAFVACWEITRFVRKVNFLTGGWLLIAPWILEYSEVLPIVNDMLVGTLVLIFARFEGEIKASYGGGWKSLWT